ncbi:tetratricopeptide repeat protein [Devosia sp. ZB163]|uniref:tetratricopeptide repeat-containing sulfotransferase family protein n=1 Tax=Devosia sp. ZB163 TaxID=3025938 RepID=UPI00235F7D2C|nr:tetratricopeptide repeat-containing sulfotransferase family protein [Devosia sp. ZB163]MDC9824127.1 tetratricopeptide repeat protein [Devosia sp. ZB163]
MRKPASPTKRSAGAEIAELLANGLAHQQAGRDTAAEALYAQVLARDPNQPGANHLLGVIRLKQGRAAEAVDFISRSVRQKPRDPQYLSNLGVALNNAGRPTEAIDVLYRALALKPDMAEAHANLGIALRAVRRYDDAAVAHRAALRIKPNEPGFHFNLGNALSDGGFPLESQMSFRRALELRPTHVGAANSLSLSLDRHGAAEEGLRVAEQVLALVPNSALLLMRRGRSLQELGRLSEAEQSLRQSIDRDPGLGEARLHLAYITRRHEPADLVAMEGLLRNVRAPVEQRTFAGFGLGKALRDSGRHEESIDTFKLANRINRQHSPFSIEEALLQLDDEARWFDDLERGQVPEASSETRHIFVVGLPRSGKTTAEKVLARHPRVTAAGELPIMMRLARKLHLEVGNESPATIDPARVAAVGSDYRVAVQALLPGSEVVVDTLPANFRSVSLIRLALPDARIVWCSRSLPELCVAIFEKHFTSGGHDYSNDLNDLLRYAAAHEARRATWVGRYPDGALAFEVGAFLRSPESSTRALLDHCGLTWHAGCAEPVASEPQLAEWSPEEQQANTAEHLDLWKKLHPELWAPVNTAVRTDA